VNFVHPWLNQTHWYTDHDYTGTSVLDVISGQPRATSRHLDVLRSIITTTALVSSPTVALMRMTESANYVGDAHTFAHAANAERVCANRLFLVLQKFPSTRVHITPLLLLMSEVSSFLQAAIKTEQKPDFRLIDQRMCFSVTKAPLIMTGSLWCCVFGIHNAEMATPDDLEWSYNSVHM